MNPTYRIVVLRLPVKSQVSSSTETTLYSRQPTAHVAAFQVRGAATQGSWLWALAVSTKLYSWGVDGLTVCSDCRPNRRCLNRAACSSSTPILDCIFTSICLSNRGPPGRLSARNSCPGLYRIRPRIVASKPDEDGYARGRNRRASS